MSTALVEGVVSVLEQLLVPGVVFVGQFSEKVTRALVGIDLLNFPLDIFEIDLFSECLILELFWAKSKILLDTSYL